MIVTECMRSAVIEGSVLVLVAMLSLLSLAYSAPESGTQGAGDSSPVFTQTIYIDRPAAEVWAALTQKHIVDKYYLCPLQKMDLKVGGDVIYGTPTREFIAGKVIHIVPGKSLSHTFKFEDHYKDEPPSVVTYKIEDMGQMSALTLTHTGFTTPKQTFADISDGWPIILSNLKTYLETGKKLPWPKGK